jgi:hypothetical protein
MVKNEGTIVVDDTNYENINSFVYKQLLAGTVSVSSDTNIISTHYHCALKKKQ